MSEICYKTPHQVRINYETRKHHEWIACEPGFLGQHSLHTHILYSSLLDLATFEFLILEGDCLGRCVLKKCNDLNIFAENRKNKKQNLILFLYIN